MEGLISNAYIICDDSPRDKSTLIGENGLKQDTFKSVDRTLATSL